MPAESRAAGRPAGTVGVREVPSFPGEGLERIGRFLEAFVQVVQSLDRLIVHLASLLIRFQGISQMVRGGWRIVRLLPTFAVGCARPG